jgi:hypothetical protein
MGYGVSDKIIKRRTVRKPGQDIIAGVIVYILTATLPVSPKLLFQDGDPLTQFGYLIKEPLLCLTSVFHFSPLNPFSCGRIAIVVVIEPDNIVLTKIFAALHLNDDKGYDSRVFQPVSDPYGDECGFVNVDDRFPRSAGDLGGPGNHDPVLASMVVLLQGEALPRTHLYPFYLVILVLLKDRILAPGPFPTFHDVIP